MLTLGISSHFLDSISEPGEGRIENLAPDVWNFSHLPVLSTSMNLVNIETLDLPGLQPYRTLRRPVEHHREGFFVAEGEKVVLRLLESPLEIVSALVTPEWLHDLEKRGDWSSRNMAVYVAPKRLLETIVGYRLHQGIMAVGRIPPPAGLNEILPSLPKPLLLVAIDGLTNAENLGVLVRNCAAFGVQALIVGETSSSPYLRRAVRNSMGSIFSLQVAPVPNLVQTLNELRSAWGVTAIAAHPRAAGTLANIDVQDNCCVVFGSEGDGISSAVLEACSTKAAIPMRDGIDSLNVASASAVFLYEVKRQRTGEE